MSTAQFTCPLIVVIPGQLITASLWNGEFNNIHTNGNPQGIGAYADTDGQFQAQTNPFPGSVTSRPTALSGEIERLRFAISQAIGETYWYNVPADTIFGLDARVATLESDAAVFASGTKMLFFQASAPTGWTQITTHNDKALRIVSGTGGGSGGTHALSSPPSLAHTHVISSADLTHKHETPIWRRTSDGSLIVKATAPYGTGTTVGDATGGGGFAAGAANNPDTTYKTNSPDTSLVHDHGGATASTSPTAFAPQYIDIIAASKS